MKPFSTSTFIFFILQCFVQLSIFAQSPTKSDTSQTLFIIEDNGKYGLMDENGEIWLEVKYDDVFFFSEIKNVKTALLRKDSYSDYEYIKPFHRYYISSSRKALFAYLPPQIRRSKEHSMHLIPYKRGSLLVYENDQCYYLNEKGKPLLDTFYEDAEPFNHGLGVVKQNRKMGVIDSTGQFIIEPKFEDIQISFDGESILLEEPFDLEYGVKKYRVDRNGQVISSEKDRTKEAHNFLNSHIFLFQNEKGKLGLKDTSTQKIITPAIYNRAKSSRKGTALVLKGKKWRLIDTTGQQVLGKTFDKVGGFVRGWAGVWADGKANFIDPKGKFLSENWFKDIEVNGFSYPYAQIEDYDCQAFYKAYSLQNISNNTAQQSLEVFENCQWKKALMDTTGKIRLTYDELKCCPTEEYPLSTIRRGNVWGIYNKDLEIVIKPQYQQIILTGSDDFHIVQMPDSEKGEKGLWGLIDSKNNVLAKPQFDQIFLNFNSKALTIKKNKKFGLMDFKQKILIHPVYDKITGLCELHCSPNSSKDYYIVQQNGKTALFDKTGNITIDFDHTYEAWDFDLAKGLIKVKVNGKFGAVDFQGNWKLSPKYDWLNRLSSQDNDFVIVGKKISPNDNWVGLWKHNEKTEKYEELLKPVYKGIFSVGENIVALSKEEGWYYYHLIHEKLLSEKPFDKFQEHHNHKFTEGSLKVLYKGKWGIIDTLGNEFVPLQYESASQFHKGLAKVTWKGKTVFIDTMGNYTDTIPKILPFVHKSPLKRFIYNEKEGLLNPETGKIVLPAEYDNIQNQKSRGGRSDRVFLGRRVAKVYQNGKIGLIDFQGKEVIPPIYDRIWNGPPIGHPSWFIKKGDKVGLVKRDGTLLLEVKYDELRQFTFNQVLYRLNGKYGLIQFGDNDSITKYQENPPPIENTMRFIPPIFDQLLGVKSAFIAQQNSKWGILKKEGRYITTEFVVKPQFDTCKIYGDYPLLSLFIAVKKKGKWGIYNDKNQLIKNITLDKAPILLQEHFEVEEKGKKRIMDFYGNLLPKTIEQVESISKRYSLFKEKGLWGVLENGTDTQKPKILHPAAFENTFKENKKNDFIYVLKDGVRGFYDIQNNNLFLDKKYDKSYLINKQYMILHKANKSSIYDLEQRSIVANTPYQFIGSSSIKNIAIVGKDNRRGLFSLQTLKEIIPPQFYRINIKNTGKENHWMVELIDRNTKAYTVLDTIGNFIIAPFKGSYFGGKNDYKIFPNSEYLVFDSTGTTIKRKPFKTQYGFPKLQAILMTNTGKWGFVNEADSLVIPPIYDNVSQNLHPNNHFYYIYDVEKNGKWGIIDTLGKVRFPPISYKEIESFSTNCFHVKNSEKIALIDSLGKRITKIKLEGIKKAGKNLLAFRQGEKWGLMNYWGKVLLSARFKRYHTFPNGFTVVQTFSEKEGLVNQQGKVIFPPIYQKIDIIIDQKNPEKVKWIKCYLNNTITYFDTRGKKIFSTNHPETYLISNTLAAIKDTTRNKWGLRNLQTSKWVLKPIFDEYKSEGDAIKSFQINPKMAYINRKGEYVWKENGFELFEK